MHRPYLPSSVGDALDPPSSTLDLFGSFMQHNPCALYLDRLYMFLTMDIELHPLYPFVLNYGR